MLVFHTADIPSHQGLQALWDLQKVTNSEKQVHVFCRIMQGCGNYEGPPGNVLNLLKHLGTAEFVLELRGWCYMKAMLYSTESKATTEIEKHGWTQLFQTIKAKVASAQSFDTPKPSFFQHPVQPGIKAIGTGGRARVPNACTIQLYHKLCTSLENTSSDAYTGRRFGHRFRSVHLLKALLRAAGITE